MEELRKYLQNTREQRGRLAQLAQNLTGTTVREEKRRTEPRRKNHQENNETTSPARRVTAKRLSMRVRVHSHYSRKVF